MQIFKEIEITFKEYLEKRNRNSKAINAISKPEARLLDISTNIRGWPLRNADREMTAEELVLLRELAASSTTLSKRTKRNLNNLDKPDNENNLHQYLYLMENSLSLLKIGVSKDPKKRSYDLANKSGFSVNLLAYWEVDSPTRGVELALHKHFSPHRCNGEWFSRGKVNITNIEKNIACGFKRIYNDEKLCRRLEN